MIPVAVDLAELRRRGITLCQDPFLSPTCLYTDTSITAWNIAMAGAWSLWVEFSLFCFGVRVLADSTRPRSVANLRSQV